MNRNEYHYAVTAGVIAEALVAVGMAGQEAARRALLVARSDAMTDWADDRHITLDGWTPGDPRTITQQQASRGIRLLLTLKKSWNRNYEAVHKWHFQRYRILDAVIADLPKAATCDDRSLIWYGPFLHNLQDCGFPESPHWGYSGVPSPANRERTKELGRLPWWRGVVRPERTWGHCLDPEADNVERCRDGCLIAARVLWRGLTCGKISEGMSPAMLRNIHRAKNDKHMEGLGRLVFEMATRERLPPFEPFAPGSAEWDIWFKEVV
jgi:hypothetical protein